MHLGRCDLGRHIQLFLPPATQANENFLLAGDIKIQQPWASLRGPTAPTLLKRGQTSLPHIQLGTPGRVHGAFLRPL